MASFPPASFSATQPPALQRRSPSPQFGERDVQPKTSSKEAEATDQADLSGTAQTRKTKPTEQRQPDAETQARNFFQDLSERINQFIKEILKAFNKLMGNQKPPSELKSEFHSYRHAVKDQAHSPDAQKEAKAFGEAIQKALPDSPLPEAEKKQIAQFAKSLQSPEGQRRYIKEVMDELPTISLYQHRQLLQDGLGKQLLAQNGDDYLHFLTTGKRRNPLAKYEALLPRQQAETDAEPEASTTK